MVDMGFLVCWGNEWTWLPAEWSHEVVAPIPEAEGSRPDRLQARPARIWGPAPPLGREADRRLDQQAPPHRPRLRAPPR